MIYIEREVEEEIKIVGIGNRGVGMEFKDGGFFLSQEMKLASVSSIFTVLPLAVYLGRGNRQRLFEVGGVL